MYPRTPDNKKNEIFKVCGKQDDLKVIQIKNNAKPNEEIKWLNEMGD